MTKYKQSDLTKKPISKEFDAMTATIFNIQKFSIHDGPGIRTVIFFKGCPLRCQWCSNPESQLPETQLIWNSAKNQNEPTGTQMTLAEVITEINKDVVFYEESGGGVTLSGGEVLFWHEFAAALLRQLTAQNIHTALETTGYAVPEIFQKVALRSNLLLFDVKHYDTIKHKQYTGVPNEPIIMNLNWAVQNKIPVIARIPVIPQFNDTPADAKKFCQLLKKLNIQHIDLLPFHQFGEQKYESLQMEYKLKNVKPLHPHDLISYKEVFTNAGFQVTG
jgi:pyruvate formate lyase activating enzyme